MHIAVTGSSGLIGTPLVASLERDGHRVTRVVRRSDPPPGSIAWDIDAGTIDRAGLEGLDAVVHLAGEGIGEKRWNPEQKRRIRESRTRGTALLAEALADLERPPAVLLSGSGVHYYGSRGDDVLTEASPPGEGFLPEVVQAWEAATAPAEAAGIRTAHLRTGVVQTPAGGALAKTLPIFRLGLGGRMGSGRQWWSWISRTDEVRAIRFLLEADVSGPVNLTAPAPVTNAEYTKVLGKVLGRPTLLPIPSFGPKLVVGSELASTLLFDSIRAEPRALVDAGFAFEHPDLESALRAELDRPV